MSEDADDDIRGRGKQKMRRVEAKRLGFRVLEQIQEWVQGMCYKGLRTYKPDFPSVLCREVSKWLGPADHLDAIGKYYMAWKIDGMDDFQKVFPDIVQLVNVIAIYERFDEESTPWPQDETGVLSLIRWYVQYLKPQFRRGGVYIHSVIKYLPNTADNTIWRTEKVIDAYRSRPLRLQHRIMII
jgi:hypothetical protein